MTWAPGSANGAATFNVRRGSLAASTADQTGPCLQNGLLTNSTSDAATPSSESSLFYIVSGVNPAGEGTLGNRKNGTLRPVTSSCP
jgi:hypothetical protein